jgi:hypothetical protein
MVYLQVMMNWQRPDPWGKYLFVQEFPVAILIHETPELFLGFHFRNSVARLVSTGGLIAQAGGLTLRVIDKSAPLFLHHAAQLLPVALDAVPIHGQSPVVIRKSTATKPACCVTHQGAKQLLASK